MDDGWRVAVHHSRSAPSPALTVGWPRLRLKPSTHVAAAGSSSGSSREGPRAALTSTGVAVAPAHSAAGIDHEQLGLGHAGPPKVTHAAAGHLMTNSCH